MENKGLTEEFGYAIIINCVDAFREFWRVKTGGISLLKELRSKEKVTGVKQARRAIRDGLALQVFLALDADPALTEALAEQCLGREIPVVRQYTMRELGQAAGIQVGAAVVTVVGPAERNI